MNIILYTMLFHFSIKPIFTFLNQNELKISLDVVEKLEIRQCILVNSIEKDYVFDIKTFSTANIPILYLNYYPLVKYIDKTEFHYFRTGLIFKEVNLDIIAKILRSFEKVKRSHKLRNFIWLTILPNQTEKTQLSKLMIPYDCQFIVIEPENETAYKLTEIYSIKNKFFSLEYGTWDEDTGLKTSNDYFYRRRLNFQKSELTVISQDVGNNHILNKEANEMLFGFAYMMNITYRRVVEKSILDGLDKLSKMGDIADMSSLFQYGFSAFDILPPFSKIEINWYIKYPRVELRSDYYLQPFDIHLWFALLAFVLLGSALTIITQLLIQNKKRLLIDNLFLALESFCNQCGYDDIENSYLRIICILLRIIAFISIGLYGAIITSFFAVEIIKPPFTNLEDFVANGEYQLISNKSGTLLALELLGRDSELYKKISQNFTKVIPVNLYEELLEHVCQGKYTAYHFSIDNIPVKPPCALYKIPENLGSFLIGMTLRKHSPFTEIFKKSSLRFQENGMQMRFKTFMNNTVLKVTPEDSFRPIKMEQMTQVLSIPLVGIFLGVAIIIFEIMNKRISLI